MFKKVLVRIYEFILFISLLLFCIGMCFGGLIGVLMSISALCWYIGRYQKIKKKAIKATKKQEEVEFIEEAEISYTQAVIDTENQQKEREYTKNKEDEQKIKRFEDEKKEKIQSVIDKNILILEEKYRQKAYIDEYGIVRTKHFDKDLNYFIDNMFNFDKLVETSNGFVRLSISSNDRAKIKEDILNRLSNIELSKDDKSPYEFEEECALILCRYGWNAYTTKKSGDQGVDVVAEKRGKKIVLQCKLYNRPVGNKAVQEVFSGKEYYKANFAAVVSNNEYTPSARELAKNCNVLLLSLSDLNNLEEKL